MPIPTIQWHDGEVKLIDQTLLPGELKHKYCKTVEEVWEAIKILRVRGAPAIGIAASFDFSFMSASIPPHWTIKPGMTRWKISPSKNSLST